MNGWFNNEGFNTYYLNHSKYAKRWQLLEAFYYTWYDCAGWPLALTQNATYKIKGIWKADFKKKMKIRLVGQGYTSGGIDGLFKTFAAWNKANPD